MLKYLISFELKFYWGQASFRAALIIFLGLGLLLSSARLGGDQVWHNGSFPISQLLALMSLGVIFAVMIFAGQGVLRDVEHRFEGVLFTTPLTHFQFLVSRFVGLFLASMLAFLPCVLGMALGHLFLAAAESVGPFQPLYYVWATLFLVAPNILLIVAVLFTTTCLTRSSRITQICGVLLYVLYWADSVLGNSPMIAGASYLPSESVGLASLIEPFGMVGLFEQTRFWTVEQKNQQFLALTGNLLLNRLLWTGLSLCIFALGYRLFSFRTNANPSPVPKEESAPSKPKALPIPVLQPEWGGLWWWRALVARVRLECSFHFRSVIFVLLVLLWSFLVIMNLSDSVIGELRVPLQPYIGLVLGDLIDPLLKLGSLVIVLFTCESYWNESRRNIEGILGAMPPPPGMMVLGKFLSMLVFIAVFVGLTAILCLVFFLVQQQVPKDFGAVLLLFPYAGIPLVWVVALTLFLQTLVNNRFVGLGLGFLVLVLGTGLLLKGILVWDQPYLRFAFVPNWVYSPQAGVFYAPVFWGYTLYWSCIALILLGLACWDRRLPFRFSSLLTWRRCWLLAPLLLMVFSGLMVYRATHRGSVPINPRVRENWMAEYEQTHADWLGLPAPQLAEVGLDLELFPDQRRASFVIHGRWENLGPTALESLPIWVDPQLALAYLTVDGTACTDWDTWGHCLYPLETPLQPGESIPFQMQASFESLGFRGLNAEAYVTAKASYLEMDKFLPRFGFQSQYLLEDQVARTKHGLPIDPQQVPAQSQMWLPLNLKVTAPKAQTVVAPGLCVERIDQDNRQIWVFTSSEPVPVAWGIACGEYESAQFELGDLVLNTYIFRGHEANLPEMVEGFQTGYPTFASSFEALNLKQINLAELAAYSDRFGGTSYWGLVYGVENRVFLLDQTRSERSVAYRMMAHELSHFWWGKRIDPLDQPGARLLTEGLAMYSEMMLYQEKFGLSGTLDFLDLTDDLYFYFRGYEKNEPALDRVGFQPFVYYFKGAHVFHTLFQVVGSERMNEALRKLLSAHGYPNQAGASDLIEVLLEVAPDQEDRIRELLQQVVTYQIRAENLVVQPLADQFQISCDVYFERRAENGLAENSSSEVEVGFFADGQDVPYRLETVSIQTGINRLSWTFKQLPNRLVVDPRRLFLDPERADQVLTLD
ncbi:MAG: hypothetical protein KDC71_07685 [Acidobacteria bacterium]|nr:hypothetical protein [Acidobacteriota bacterium]